MQPLPVVTGFGGFNAGGRSSFHQSFRRTIFESLDQTERSKTLLGLACAMQLVTAENNGYRTGQGELLNADQVVSRFEKDVINGSLVRRIENNHFDPDHASMNQLLPVSMPGQPLQFEVRQRDLPNPIPTNWQVEERENKNVHVTISDSQEFLVKSSRNFDVKAAGQLPSGFEPGSYYNSRYQPRALQMTVLGATDAVRSLGLPWDQVLQSVRPDQIGVYASSVFGQIGEEGYGGLLASRYQGGRPTSKSVPMSLNTMPADFLNAYIIGSLGHTEANVGACATFLYNLRSAIDDIKSGRRRIAFVGNAEAPIDSDLMEGFYIMGALATVDGLAKIEGLENPDLRRASRPFGENCGFTIGESAQYVVLTDDALAIELGLDIHGAASDVFINADGIKKSISGPGPGNYITFAKALSATQAILGKEAVRTRSMIQAHGSSTPQNRVTESHIFHVIAENFGIENWPVAAVKAFFGHTQGTASGDQFVSSLGTFRYGIIPGIKTIDAVADDVYANHLMFPLKDYEVGVANIDISFINAKGFGGNNATGVALSPRVVENMLQKRYGKSIWQDYCQRREAIRAAASVYEQQADRGDFQPIYRYGEGLIDENAIRISEHEIIMPGFNNPVKLDIPNPYEDMV